MKANRRFLFALLLSATAPLAGRHKCAKDIQVKGELVIVIQMQKDTQMHFEKCDPDKHTKA